MNWNNWLYADRLGEEKQTPKPKTNADRIREMSDEELVDVLQSDSCCPEGYIAKCHFFDSCKECWIAWLKQPAEENEYG